VTSDDARELMSDAYDGSLDAAQRAAFDAALEADDELAAEYAELKSLLDEAHALDGDELPTPDLLGGVQKKIRERSKGRFYRDRFAESGGLGWTPLLLGLVMLIILGAAWFGLGYIELTP